MSKEKLRMFNEAVGSLGAKEEILGNINHGFDVTDPVNLLLVEQITDSFIGASEAYKSFIGLVRSGVPLGGLKAMLEGQIEETKAFLEELTEEGLDEKSVEEGVSCGTEAADESSFN